MAWTSRNVPHDGSATSAPADDGLYRLDSVTHGESSLRAPEAQRLHIHGSSAFRRRQILAQEGRLVPAGFAAALGEDRGGGGQGDGQPCRWDEVCLRTGNMLWKHTVGCMMHSYCLQDAHWTTSASTMHGTRRIESPASRSEVEQGKRFM